MPFLLFVSITRQGIFYKLTGQRAAELLLWTLAPKNGPVENTQMQVGVELALRSSIRT